MFWISFVVFIVSTIMYSLWASGKVQPWNEPHKMGALESGQFSTKDDFSSPSKFGVAESGLTKTDKH